MRSAIHTMTAAAALALVLAASAAHAQGTAAASVYDPSIRAAGIGGGASAVFWGGDANWWANPALLGYARGLRFERGRTQLVPDLASDVWFDSERWSIGGGGLGIGMAGRPGDLGRTFLDYGLSPEVDLSGNVVGFFRSYEEVASWSVGVSAAGLARTLAAWRHATPPSIASYADLALGMTSKEVRVVLAPGAGARADERDWGLLARVTPLDNARSGATPNVPFRLDLAYGYSVLNASDAKLTFLNEDSASPVARSYFNGFAARGEWGLPAAARARFGRVGWLAESFEPLVSLGASWDFEHVQAGSEANSGYDVRHLGGELALANILTLRTGHLEDKIGVISGGTWGWGLGFHVGRFAGFRYDYGTRPEGTGLSDVKRRGWTTFLDLGAFAALGHPS